MLIGCNITKLGWYFGCAYKKPNNVLMFLLNLKGPGSESGSRITLNLDPKHFHLLYLSFKFCFYFQTKLRCSACAKPYCGRHIQLTCRNCYVPQPAQQLLMPPPLVLQHRRQQVPVPVPVHLQQRVRPPEVQEELRVLQQNLVHREGNVHRERNVLRERNIPHDRNVLHEVNVHQEENVILHHPPGLHHPPASHHPAHHQVQEQQAAHIQQEPDSVDVQIQKYERLLMLQQRTQAFNQSFNLPSPLAQSSPVSVIQASQASMNQPHPVVSPVAGQSHVIRPHPVVSPVAGPSHVNRSQPVVSPVAGPSHVNRPHPVVSPVARPLHVNRPPIVTRPTPAIVTPPARRSIISPSSSSPSIVTDSSILARPFLSEPSENSDSD